MVQQWLKKTLREPPGPGCDRLPYQKVPWLNHVLGHGSTMVNYGKTVWSTPKQRLNHVFVMVQPCSQPWCGQTIPLKPWLNYCTFLVLCKLIGVSGNLLVLAVIIWKLVKTPQHRVMTIFVGSLAVSDLGLLLWVTWINALLSLNPEWRIDRLGVSIRNGCLDCWFVGCT